MSITPDEWKAAREAFGDLLLRWRSSNGWSGQTAEDWQRACPELLPYKILNSVWTGLELKRNERTAPATFRALGDVNQLLAQEDRGMIRERRLRERVYRAEPIRHPDGTPWDHTDFYRAFWGEVEFPPHLRSEPVMSEDEAEEWSLKWRLEFRKIQAGRGLRPREALTQLLRQVQPQPSADDIASLEDLAFGFASLSPDQVHLRASADAALRRWAEEV